jgi:hypothetical protein
MPTFGLGGAVRRAEREDAEGEEAVTQAQTTIDQARPAAGAPPDEGGGGRRAAIDAACLERAEQMLRPGYDFGRRFAPADWWILAAVTLVFLVLMYVGFLL